MHRLNVKQQTCIALNLSFNLSYLDLLDSYFLSCLNEHVFYICLCNMLHNILHIFMHK